MQTLQQGPYWIHVEKTRTDLALFIKTSATDVNPTVGYVVVVHCVMDLGEAELQTATTQASESNMYKVLPIKS